MGWTHRAAPVMLRRYPGYQNIPVLMERWPALREAVEQLRGEQGTPPGGGTPPSDDTPPRAE
ncbi:hypothetical protein [Roseibium alexandrii]|uniref:Uncharacterized protein n=1 Tax=Roseibium alexandrii (strain DSM 17067 / NCIMB 14079 / DFL-11) TaxID=244592 RepID=A0A5E8GUT6_ROSAD|nr:hypothetical protein [Roseibium alexandrii]EEE43693.1 hypothetical protein SADFL11_979 [Roseibium alexandrii DFL-11]